MNIGLIIIIGILVLICILLILKIYLMKKAVSEIDEDVDEILNSDTNHIITISGADKDINQLTGKLNRELRDLRSQKLQYENGNQELKRLITNISHDMRTPLTAISGYIDLMQKEQLSKNQKNYLEVIQRKSSELTGLTEQLFDFSKTMDIGIKIKKERCCINEILEEVLTNYYIIFTEKNIEPQIQICNEKIYKNVDKNTIIRVFDNILINVSKYSDGDFKVVLDKNGKITFSNKATSLDATTVKKIFDRYYTVENARKSTGIGLSIAKQLVELNNGTIIAEYTRGYLMIEIEL